MKPLLTPPCGVGLSAREVHIKAMEIDTAGYGNRHSGFRRGNCLLSDQVSASIPDQVSVNITVGQGYVPCDKAMTRYGLPYCLP